MAASGTGKGVWIKSKLDELQPTRLVIWDFKNEYGDYAKKVESRKALREAMLAAGDGPARLRYVTPKSGTKDMREDFGHMCTLVQAWERCVFIAEELANVTTPGWAPGPWLKMTTGGRHEGIHIIGTSQTPATIDKTFLGNCTLIHVGPLRQRAHRKAVAESMDIDEGRLARLVKFGWIEKDFDSGEVRDGQTYPKGYKKAPPAPTKEPTNAPRGRGPSGSARGSGKAGHGGGRRVTVAP